MHFGFKGGRQFIRRAAYLASVVGGIALACGGGNGGDGGHGGGNPPPATYSIGGTVAGLAGTGLVLRDNGADDLSLSHNGSFTFSKRLTGGSGYSVAVATQPSAPVQTCTVSQGIGTVHNQDIKTVAVTCQSKPLTLTSSVPASGGVDVSTTTPLVLTFSAALNASTVTTGNVTLIGPSGTVAISASASGNTMTVNASSALAVHTAYTLHVSTALRGAGGEQLAAEVALAFTTAGKPWTSLIARSQTLLGGLSEEAYKCTAIVAPTDMYITGFRTIAGPGFRLAFVAIPAQMPALGDFDCSLEELQGAKPIYAAATGTDDFLFPQGFGIHVLAGEPLVLIADVVNDGSADSTESEEIQVQIGAATDVITNAEMIILGRPAFSIPPDTVPVVENGSSGLAHDRQLLALLPLMRTHAIHQSVQLFTQASAEAQRQTQVLLDTDFDPNRQIFHPLSPVSVQSSVGFPQASINVACSYMNNGPGTIVSGESQFDEICMSALYASPSYDDAFPAGFGLDF
ncbi:MAG TPA: Ig-like domain-containing protein [Steroidobacteraceae bacterium]|jgi:hypothetical protein